jgi:hypothetical protein
MERILLKHERQMTSLADDIGRIDGNGYTGVGLIKIHPHEGADVSGAVSELASSAQSVRKSILRNITPPLVVCYDTTYWRLTVMVLASIKTAMLGLCVGGQILNTLILGGSAFATGILVADADGERLTLLDQQPDHQWREGRYRVDVGGG